MSSSNEHAKKLLADRVEFKLFSAEQHLDRLRDIKSAYGDISKDSARIETEMEIDCLLLQLIGAVDSLLFRINDALDLGIPSDRVNFANVQSALTARTKRIDLLYELDSARQSGGWYYLLSELRNESVQGTLLGKITMVRSHSLKYREINGNPPDLSINEHAIQYLDNSLRQVREIISSIREKEPLLR